MIRKALQYLHLIAARIAGEPMYSWEQHHGCSYLLLGTDYEYYLNLTDARQACANADAGLASFRTEDEWNGVKNVIETCELIDWW